MNQVRLGPSLKSLIKTAEDQSRLIITPRYDDFLRKNPDIVFDADVIGEVMKAFLKRQESRAGRLGGSSAGKCFRAQVLGYLGSPGFGTDTQLQRIFEDGKWRGARLQATLMQAGIIDRVEVPVRWRRARAYGQIDGAGIVPNDHPNSLWRGLEFGLEIKGAMSFAYQSIERHGPEKYLEQVARYFLYTGFELFVILVESKDTQRIQEFVVTEADVSTGRALTELQTINDYIDQQKLPPKLDSCAMARGPNFNACQYGQSTAGTCHQTNETW